MPVKHRAIRKEEYMKNLNYDNLSEERQKIILNNLKAHHYNLFIYREPFFIQIAQKFKYRKLLRAKTLKEYIELQQDLHERGVCYGDVYEYITEPYIGISCDELYSLGLEKSKVDRWIKLNKETDNKIISIVGKDIYKKTNQYLLEHIQ